MVLEIAAPVSNVVESNHALPVPLGTIVSAIAILLEKAEVASDVVET